MPNDTSQLDKSIVNLMHGIKVQESNGNYNALGDKNSQGNYTAAGIGQWSNQVNGKPMPIKAGQIPSNFANAAKGFGLDPTDFSPANQNKVMYATLAADKKNGLTPQQTLSKWNSGDPNKYLNTATSSGMGSVGSYNVASYVKNAMSYAQQYAQQQRSLNGGSATITPTTPQTGITGNENPLQAAGNAIANTPGSALNFGIDVAKSFNPITTANTIGQIGSGFQDLSQQEGTGQAIWDIIKGIPGAAYQTLVPKAIQQAVSGDFQGASKTAQQDPFGTAAPLVLAAEGATKLADTYAGGLKTVAEQNAAEFNAGETNIKTMPKQGAFNQAFDTGVSKVGGMATAPIAPALRTGVTLGQSVLSHIIGLSPETITTVLSDPESFSKLKQEAINRPSIAEDFGNAIDALEQTKSETGAEYQTVRANATPVTIDTNFVTKVLTDNGFKIQDGQIVADTNSITRNKADINALQSFLDNWGDKKTFTANEYLNMRQDAADLSKFDSAKTGAASKVGKQLYAQGNEAVRSKIPGLKELDARMSPQIEQYKQIKKDFLDKDGNFKPGAINKIANAGGLGKGELLNRMEAISPGITKSLQVLKAVEDIQKANGIKVGNYTRAIIEGGGFLTGNIPLIVSAILTHPTIAVQILRGFGITGKAALPIIGALQTLSGALNDNKASTELSPKAKEAVTSLQSAVRLQVLTNPARTKSLTPQ